MKIRAYLAILVLWTLPIAALYCNNRVLGTNIEMDIATLYKRDDVLNSYRALGAYSTYASMKVYYERSDLHACIAKHKPRIFNEQLNILDKEWYEGEDKYLMLFHIKGFESQKTCVLFIGDRREAVIFISRINTGALPNLYDQTINAYLSSKKATTAFDFREALFYKIELPNDFVLQYSEGSFFEVRRNDNQKSGELLIQFHTTIYGREIKIQPERWLSAFVRKNETIVQSNEYKAASGSIGAWRMLTKETSGSSYRCRYLILLSDRRMLFINGVIHSQEPKEALDDISEIVNSIRFD